MNRPGRCSLVAALLVACTDNAPPLPMVETLKEGNIQQSDNAEAYARALALGCHFKTDGSLECPRLWVLNNSSGFRSIDKMPSPLVPQRMEDRLDTELIEIARQWVADPASSGQDEYTIELARYVLANLEMEDAIARAGCSTMEDDCAHGVRARFGWDGFESPEYPGGMPRRR